MIIGIPVFVVLAILTGCTLAVIAVRSPRWQARLVTLARWCFAVPIAGYLFLVILMRLGGVFERRIAPIFLPVLVVLIFLFIVALAFGAVYPLLVRKKQVLTAFAFMGLAVCLLGAYVFWGYSQCRVTITNRSGHSISNGLLILNGNGPVVEVGTLKDGARRTFRVYPPGESSLEFAFEGANGKAGKGIAGYIEAEGYHVRFTIQPDDQVIHK